MSKGSRKYIPYDHPATYQISVQGRIDPLWSDRLEGLALLSVTDEQGASITTLEGELADQAALAGVLTSLYELHLPILLVKCKDISNYPDLPSD